MLKVVHLSYTYRLIMCPGGILIIIDLYNRLIVLIYFNNFFNNNSLRAIWPPQIVTG